MPGATSSTPLVKSAMRHVAIMIHSARRIKTIRRREVSKGLLFGSELNVNLIKRNYKLVCQSGTGLGSRDPGSGTTSQAPRAKFQAHTSLNEQETAMPRSPGARKANSLRVKVVGQAFSHYNY